MAPAVVAGFDDLAVMGETVEECGSPFGVTKDRGSFTESKLGSDNDRSAFIEAADEIEQQLPACLGKGQIAQFVEHDEVNAGKGICKAALPAATGFSFEPVDQINDIVEAASGSFADAGLRNGHGQMALAGSGAAD